MPTSSPIKRHGGKAYLAQKIRALFAPHTRYCEPFFGSGAVLFSGDGEAVAEFVNDLDGHLAHFWQVMAHELYFEKFQRAVEAVPFSEPRFEQAKKASETLATMVDTRIPGGLDRIGRAVRFFIINRQSRQGLGRDFATPTSRLRRGMNEQVSAWLSAVEGLPEFHARLKRVEIRCQDAKDFIRELDSPDTLFYCDPPYMHETRSTTKEYGDHEMSDEGHHNLLCCLKLVKGNVVLSGYRSAMYDDHLSKWRRVDFEIPNQASSAKTKERKIECVWMNYQPPESP